MKNLPYNRPVLAAILSPEARLRALFWIERQSENLRLYASRHEYLRLLESLEFFKFSEDVQWNDRGSSPTIWTPNQPDTPWGKFEFGADEASNLSETEWNQRRIEHLIAERELDFDQENIFELGLDWICDDNKGCYVGQEVVERVRSRKGKPAYYLAHIEFESVESVELLAQDELWSEPEAGQTEPQKVGRMTKTVSQISGRYHGLSFIQRSFCHGATKIIAKNSKSSGSIVASIDGRNSSP